MRCWSLTRGGWFSGEAIISWWPKVVSTVDSTAPGSRKDWPSVKISTHLWMLDNGAVANLDPSITARLKRNPQGLIPAIVQQYDTGEVLMLAWMDEQALSTTIATRKGTYWSRSRQSYWTKGETSGNYQRVISVALDCDGDTVLVKVDQTGVACHTGARTCFEADVLLAPRTGELGG